MAVFDGYGKRETVAIGSFGGLNRLGPLCGGKDCFELRNLRPMADGTLVRREGFAPWVRFDGNVRGMFSTERDGVRETYAVAGETVYYVAQDGTVSAIGQSTTAEGKVNFICTDGKILLLDGSSVLVLVPTEVRELAAYIPLYGKNWGANSQDANRVVYEPPSLLTDRLRVGFVLAESSADIYLTGLTPLTIDRVIINGQVFEGTWFYNKTQRRFFLETPLAAGTQVELYLTMPKGHWGDRPALGEAAHCVSIGDAEDARLLFFGGSVTLGGVYVTRAIERQNKETVRTYEPDICMIYVTAEDLVMPGDGIHPVTGACRHYDRSLIFTSHDAWMADGTLTEGGKIRLIPVNTTMGCSSADACGVVGNSPYTVFGRRILRWNSDTDERNECNAEAVSAAIEPLLDEGFGSDCEMFADKRRRELWLFCPGRDGRVLIRREDDGKWTSFDGFSPRGMFAMGERIGFYTGQTVYLFDEAAVCDTVEDGSTRPIEAEYMSQYLDFGSAGRLKRLCGGTVVADCGRMHSELRFQDVRGRQFVAPLYGKGDEISVLQSRGRCGRFRYLRAGIYCADVGPLRLHGLTITVCP